MTMTRPSLRLGFGASGAWSKAWFSESEAVARVREAIDLGVRVFDTAPFYADGEAERRLGVALGKIDAIVTTKTGTRYRGLRPAEKDFSDQAIRRDVDASLKRLRRERLDLLFLHGPSERQINDAKPTLFRLIESGKIGAWGVCGAGAPLRHAVTAGASAVMGVYNLLHREHAGVFSRARAAGAMVFAIAPLAQGLYRRDFFYPRSMADVWHLARALARNRDELARARDVRPVLESVPGWTPAQVALAFTLANPDIDVALTTTTKSHHLVQSARATSSPLPNELLARLIALDGPQAGA